MYNKILVEIHHGIGDVIQMLPLIHNLRENYRETKISVIVASSVQAEILEISGLVDEYYFLNLRKMKFGELINFILKIRKEKYDLAFLSPISNKKMGAILLYILGCKNRVGEVSGNKKFIINHNLQVLEREDLHKVDRNLNLLSAININPIENRASLQISKALNDRAVNLLKTFAGKRLIGVCIGTNPVERKVKDGIESVEAKKWPIEKYLDLIERLTTLNQDINIVLIGGKKEELEVEEYLNKIEKNPKVLNLINQTSLSESAAIIEQCELTIGGDTGMLHIADALYKKTLTIFGPTDPEIVGPYSDLANNVSLNLPCQYCYLTTEIFECSNRICIDNISVDLIFNTTMEILNNEG